MEIRKKKICGLQGHEKEKDLVHHEDEQGLKLCVFILGKRQTFLPQRA